MNYPNNILLLDTTAYHANGNILSNSKVGDYSYGTNMSPPKPHAVTEIEPVSSGALPSTQNAVTYNFFNQPTQITDASTSLSNSIDLYYNANQQRHKAMQYKNNNLLSTRYYVSKYYEKEIDSAGAVRHYHYIYGDNGVVALHISYPTSDSAQTLYRGGQDPPGGEPHSVFPINFAITARGFTGHEHYTQFKIINMNGRLYDPVIGRFFSPDNSVQLPEFTQGFNRYSYCLNNPLKYTDPTGQYIWTLGLLSWLKGFSGLFCSSMFSSLDNATSDPGKNGNVLSSSNLSGTIPFTVLSPVEIEGKTPARLSDFPGRFSVPASFSTPQHNMGIAQPVANTANSYRPIPLPAPSLAAEISIPGDMGNLKLPEIPNDNNGKMAQDFSLFKMYQHFQTGGKQPMTIKMSSINLSGTTQRTLGLTGSIIGKPEPVNLFNAGTFHPVALAFGRVNMINHGNDQFSIVGDESSRFDFDPLIDWGAGWGRNIGNVLGLAVNYNLFYLHFGAPYIPMRFGGPFDVYFIGTTYIPK